MQLEVQGKYNDLRALIDSGAAGNFMLEVFARHNNVPLTECLSPLAVKAIDGQPLGKGRIKFVTQDIRLQVGIHHR